MFEAMAASGLIYKTLWSNLGIRAYLESVLVLELISGGQLLAGHTQYRLRLSLRLGRQMPLLVWLSPPPSRMNSVLPTTKEQVAILPTRTDLQHRNFACRFTRPDQHGLVA